MNRFKTPFLHSIKSIFAFFSIAAMPLFILSCDMKGTSISVQLSTMPTESQALENDNFTSSIQSYIMLPYDLDMLPDQDANCTGLVNTSSELWFTNGALAAAQVVNPTEKVEHTFGILNEGFYGVLVLGTTTPYRDFTRSAAPINILEQAMGSIIATGCTEIDIEPGSRTSIHVILYPAGRL